ncbi:MAG: translation initiation factor IF-3 [Patescibacteria group bacterium]
MTGHGCNSHQLHHFNNKKKKLRRRRHNRPKPKVQVKDRLRVNDQILVPEVIVIDLNGENHGLMEISAAIALAQEQEADLVEVSPLAKPPVCKITDYGKLQYRQAKQEQQAKAKQKKIDIKGIRIGFRTDTHDLLFKKSQAEKFLTKGQKVRIEIVLRGREKAMLDKARENLNVFLKTIAVPYRFEEEVKRGPMGFNAMIVPE